MAFAPLINGRAYDWAQITATIAGVPVAGITSITYSEERTVEENFGAGSRPVSRGFGNIEASATIGLHMTEVERIQLVAPNRNLMEIPEFDVTVTFAAEDQVPANHIIKNCRFKNNSRDMSQGDTGVSVDLELAVSHIKF
jgi:hypothetical protein